MAQLGLWAEDTTRDGDRDAWATPADLRRRVLAEWPISLDAAAVAETALVPRFLGPGSPLGDDALLADWRTLSGDGWVWCNPPFSRLAEFCGKAVDEAHRGARIVMLTPGGRTEQAWWHSCVAACRICGEVAWAHKRHVGPCRPIGRVIPILGRVAYEPPPGVEVSSPSFASVLVVYE